MNWREKYNDPFAYECEDEQEYIDQLFIMIVLFNFRVWLEPDVLCAELASP